MAAKKREIRRKKSERRKRRKRKRKRRRKREERRRTIAESFDALGVAIECARDEDVEELHQHTLDIAPLTKEETMRNLSYAKKRRGREMKREKRLARKP